MEDVLGYISGSKPDRLRVCTLSLLLENAKLFSKWIHQLTVVINVLQSFFPASPQSLTDLSSPTRDRTNILSSVSAKS